MFFEQDPTKPFLTVVTVNEAEYGKAAYLNKKMSKQLAAAATLEVLISSELIQLIIIVFSLY